LRNDKDGNGQNRIHFSVKNESEIRYFDRPGTKIGHYLRTPGDERYTGVSHCRHNVIQRQISCLSYRTWKAKRQLKNICGAGASYTYSRWYGNQGILRFVRNSFSKIRGKTEGEKQKDKMERRDTRGEMNTL
jgi:hypothetical protein